MNHKKLIFLFQFSFIPVASAIAMPGQSPTEYRWDHPQIIFQQHDKTSTNSYRIPAITTTNENTIIAVTDARASGTSDIGLNKEIHFDYRLSPNAGNSWSPFREITPGIDGKTQISDPAIVHNTDTGSTFLFGFYNDKFIISKPPSNNSDFFMFQSNDGGKTWNNGISLKNLVPDGYKYILQGPGSGMYYNGTIYLSAQAWHNSKDTGVTATSGFIYSADNGKTWQSAWLRPDDKIKGAPGTDGLPDISSESNVFHHDGYIYLAVKPETSREHKNRITYRTKDNGKNWERVDEDFLPDNLARAESSSLSLDDNIYLVGYTTKTARAGRDGIYITNNKGRKIQVYDKPVFGYTSMTQDADNLYILFEGEGDILFQRYDLASKDYANLNAITLQRSDNLFDIQDKLRKDKSYIKGSYGKHEEYTTELLYAHNKIKLGVFRIKQTDSSQHVYRTIAYSNTDTSFALSKDQLIFHNDNVFIGWQVSDINYVNKSYNKVNSWLLGYSFLHDFHDLAYKLALNAIYSNNNFSRNHLEGLGRTANFKSYSFSLNNALSKVVYFSPDFSAHMTSGLNTTFFSHTAFNEKGGNSWNNITLNASDHWSNEFFARADINKLYNLSQSVDLTLTTKISYQYELMNSARWAESYIVLNARRLMPSPVKNYSSGFIRGTLEANFDINKRVTITAAASLDTDGERRINGVIKYAF